MSGGFFKELDANVVCKWTIYPAELQRADFTAQYEALWESEAKHAKSETTEAL